MATQKTSEKLVEGNIQPNKVRPKYDIYYQNKDPQKPNKSDNKKSDIFKKQTKPPIDLEERLEQVEAITDKVKQDLKRQDLMREKHNYIQQKINVMNHGFEYSDDEDDQTINYGSFYSSDDDQENQKESFINYGGFESSDNEDLQNQQSSFINYGYVSDDDHHSTSVGEYSPTSSVKSLGSIMSNDYYDEDTDQILQ